MRIRPCFLTRNATQGFGTHPSAIVLVIGKRPQPWMAGMREGSQADSRTTRLDAEQFGTKILPVSLDRPAVVGCRETNCLSPRIFINRI
ncbi:hypothetical protein PACF725_1094 [Pseudomonas aeruginosa]|nr:hypothetical protein PACF725_1094 [Pseudomonas aeruginosa]